MELYKQYLKEREDIDLIYTDECFITYKVYNENTAAIIDIYSKPEVRGKQVMKGLVEELVASFKEKGITTVLGYTDITTNGWQRSEELMTKFGFEYKGTHPDDAYRNVYILKLQVTK